MKMLCTKCGKKIGVRKQVYEKRIEKYGSEEKLLESYVCRNCRGFATNQILQKQLAVLKESNPDLYNRIVNGKKSSKYQKIKKKQFILELRI